MKSDVPPQMVSASKDSILPGAPFPAGVVEWFPLRLLGRIPTEQRAGLVAGEPIKLDALPPPVQRMLQMAVFERHAWSFVTAQSEAPKSSILDYLLDQEPTEVLPNGFAPDAKVTMRTVVRRGRVAGAVSSSGSIQPLDAPQFAGHELGMQYPYLANDSPIPVTEPLRRFQPGYRSLYDFEWQLGGGTSLQYRLFDYEFELHSPPVGIKDLPAEFLRELEETKARFVKEQSGSVGAGSPPP